MREGLKNINGVRQTFVATFERFGKKNGFKGYPVTTLLFNDVKDKYGTVFTDHLWFSDCEGWKKLNLQEGDKVSFDARVKTYIKGYKGRRDDIDAPPISKDYKLSHPNNMVKSQTLKSGLLF